MNHDAIERTFKEMFLGALLAVIVMLAIDDWGAAQFKSLMDELQARSVITPEGRLAVGPSGDLTRDTKPVLSASRAADHWLDDLQAPHSRRFMVSVADVLEQNEGRTAFAYDDETGKRVVPGKPVKGSRTVAVGFNLDRPTAKRLVEQVGADYAAVRSGRAPLSRGQQDKLLALAVRETVAWLRDHFKGVDMTNHRWQALISLAYNSRWNDRGPTLIGERLTKAVREERWEDAAREIATSTGGVPAHLKRGIEARRKREANLFRSSLMAAAGR